MTIRYIPYYPEPVSGQAVLSNFNRLLRYKGSNDLEPRLARGMPLYEAELVETVGDPGSGNMVFRGDCMSTCAYLKDKGIKVDLVYIDPPFASGADYAKKIYLRRNPKIAEAIEKAESELSMDDFKQFEEKMYGDIWDKEKYLSWMYENLLAIRSVMSEKASIYVELDTHIGHYVKILMDEIFGEDHFVNEIIWRRTFSHSDVGQGAKHLGRLHDIIFYYTMSDDYVLNTVYTPHSEDYIKNFYRYEDGDGRRYRLVSMLGPGGAAKGNPFYEVMGVSRYWAFSKERMQKMIDEGRVVQNSPGSVPQKKLYLDETPGVPLQDIWMDVPAVQGGATENCNYATQKPELLLERIIRSSSNEGMTVADFFGGSGVTAAVAHKLGRKFIHSDVGINSIQTTRDRLKTINGRFDVFEIKDGVSLYRNPVQTMDKLKSLIPGLKNEDSLDKFWEGAINDPRFGLVPVYVPNLMDSSTRILYEALMRRILYEAIPDLADLPNVKKVVVYYIDVSDMDKILDIVSKDKDLNLEIEFRDLKDVLDDVVLEDEIEYDLDEDRSIIDGGFVMRISRFYSDAVVRRIDSFNLKSAQNDKKGKFKPITVSDNGLELIEFISLDCSSGDGPWNSDFEIKIEYTSKLTLNGMKTDEYWDGTIRFPRRPLRMKVRNICGDETVFLMR